MRVVAGTARGRRLLAPDGRETRPTADRVREATFNALGSLDAIDGAVVVDLFAGSGALGIEALSRGAAHCTFVEQHRDAVAVIRQNLASTGLADRATVVTAEVAGWLAARSDRGADRGIDLALVDPPYRYESWGALLAALPAPLVVVESNRDIDPPPGWATLRSRRYGTTVTTFLARDEGSDDDPDPDAP